MCVCVCVKCTCYLTRMASETKIIWSEFYFAIKVSRDYLLENADRKCYNCSYSTSIFLTFMLSIHMEIDEK